MIVIFATTTKMKSFYDAIIAASIMSTKQM